MSYGSSAKKKKKTIIYLISGLLIITGIGAITYFVAWPKNKSIENKTSANSKEQIQNLQTKLTSLEIKLNNLSDNTQKTQLQNKLFNIKNQINNPSNHDKSTIKKLEQEIKKLKQQLEGNDKPDENDNPDNKEEDEFVYFTLLNGYHLFENASLGQPSQNQIVIKISEGHPRIKLLLNEGKLQGNKQFTIRYGKVDKKPKRDSLIFNENNQELEIIESKNPSPNPNPQPENKGWKYIATKINDNTYKYHITFESDKIDFSDFISFLAGSNKLNINNIFFKTFQGALKDANSKFSAYFWKCPPVSKKTLNKPFEFVVIKSEALNNITQNWKPFSQYLAETSLLGKPAVSFPSLSNNSILIVPKLTKSGNQTLDYKNISQFTKNAPDEQQKEFWKEVANKLIEELEKNVDAPRWLNTEGTGVHYLHVRIDETARFYGNYKEYEK